MRWTVGLLSGLLCLGVTGSPPAAAQTPCPTPTPAPTSPATMSENARMALFEAVWEAVDERYVERDRELHGHRLPV
jgi:hypothetical protein